jgi:hypothetical protein
MVKFYNYFKKTHFMLAFFVILSVFGNSQTILINPTAEGGFELGSSFAANGWTTVNTATTNGSQWYLTGTSLSNGSYGFTPTGANAAYASSDLGATWSYQTPLAASSASHFYRDITFPAGETAINLSFRLNCNGENNYDEVQVYLCPTTLTPTANLPTGTGITPTWTGTGTASFIGRYSLLSAGNGSNINLSIPPSIVGNCVSSTTWRLVFTWKNDGGGGTNPPAAIDDIALVSSASPITLAGGNFTIDNTQPTAGSNFQNFTAAITALNSASACGAFTGPVVFDVIAGQTFSELPPAIIASGTAVNTITFQKAGSGANPVITPNGTGGTADAGITISGGDYFIFDGIDVNASAVTNVEYGYIIRNLTATNGAQNNLINNCTVTLNRNVTTSTSSGILQTASTTGGGITPTSAAGANSNNIYRNFSVSNALNGIYLNGNATNPDLNTVIGTTDCSIRNTFTNLGPLVSTFTSARGVWAVNQTNVQIYHNDVNNVAGNQGVTSGIFGSGLNGNALVYNNNVTNVSVFGSTTTTSSANGLNLSLTTTGTHNIKIFNNTISNIYTSFTGTATASRYAIGISTGTGTLTSSYDVDNNSVSIGAGLTPNYSTTCFQTGGSAAIYNVRGNIFANYTGAQTSPARHTVYATTATAAFGAASSVTSYNDLYIQNGLGVSGFTAVTNTTTRTTIADFTAAVTPAGLEAGSVTADPLYVNNLNNLHAQAVESNAVSGFTPAAWVSNDMDCEVRSSLTPNDLGADAYNVLFCAGTPDPSTTVSTVSTACPTVNFGLSLGTTYTGVGFSYQWQSSADGITYNNISGATNANLTTSLLTSTYYQCIITCSVSGISTTSTPVQVTQNSFLNCYCTNNATNTADTDIGNVTLGSLNNGSATPVTSNPAANGTFSNFTALPLQDFALGTNYPLSLSQITSGATFYAAQFNVFIDYNQDGVFDNTTERVFTGATAPGPPIVSTLTGSVTIPATATLGTTRMRVSLNESGNATSPACGTFSYGETEDYFINIVCPTLAAPTFTGASICAGTTATISAATSVGTISWYDAAIGGTNVGSGNSYTTPILLSTTSYFAQADFTGCPSGPRSEVVVTVDPVNAILTPVNVTCNGGNNGSFTLGTVTCGVLPFTYSINGGAFGAIPTDLTAGTYNVIIKDNANFQSAPISVVVTEPSWTIDNPTGTNDALCLGDLSAQITAVSNTTITNTSSSSVTFDLATQPLEVSASVVPSVTTTPNIIMTANLPTLPAGATVTGVTFSMPGLTALGGSWQSDLNIGFTGAVSAPYAPGTGTLNTSGAFGYSRTLAANTVNTSGGTVNIHYFDAYNDNTGAESAFPTGLGVATLTVNYTFPTAAAINWYNASTGGTLLGTGSPLEAIGTSVLPNSNTAGVYNFYAEAAYLGCTSSTRTLVTATVNALPSVDAGVDQTLCAGTSVTLTGAGTDTYSWNNGVSNSVSFIPTSTTTYTVTGTNTTTGCTNTDQVSVTVNALPVVNGGLDQTVCAGTSVTLSASGADSYNWTNGITDNVSFVPTSTVNYTVTGTNTSTGCTNTDQVAVTVNALPIVNAGLDTAICIGQAITLNGSGAATYNWNNGVVNNVSFIPLNTLNYAVTGTDNNGCTGSDTVAVTVNALPNIFAGVDTTLCSGSSLTLSGTGGVSYSWDNGIQNAVAFNATSNTLFTVTGTDVNGCVNTDDVQVNIYALPSVNAGNDFAVCQNAQIVLTATGANTYAWNNNVVNSIPFAITGTTTYAVVGTDLNGCQAADSITVSANPLPNVDAGNTIEQCGDQTVTLTATGAVTYVWNNSVQNGVSFQSPIGTTAYIVTGIDGFGCSSTDIVNVTINAIPNAQATAANAITLVATPANANYQWINCSDDTAILGATGSTFTATENGSYAVIITGNGGCTDTSECVIVDQVGLSDLGVEFGLELYPNPTRENIYVYFTKVETLTFNMFDAQGKLIISNKYIQSGDQIDLSVFENGVYTIEMKDENLQSIIRRIIKN